MLMQKNKHQYVKPFYCCIDKHVTMLYKVKLIVYIENSKYITQGFDGHIYFFISLNYCKKLILFFFKNAQTFKIDLPN